MKIIKQKKDNPGRSVSSFSSRGSAGISGFTDNRPVAQAQAKTIQVIQRVGGETVGYEGEDSDLIALLQKGREVNKIKKRAGTEANKKVLDKITALTTSETQPAKIEKFERAKKERKTDQVKMIYSPYLKSVSLSKDFLREIAPEKPDHIKNKIQEDEETVVHDSTAKEDNKRDFKEAFKTHLDSTTVPTECKEIPIEAKKIDQLQTGADAFKSVSLPEREAARITDSGKKGPVPELYTKKGKTGSQYIKDDLDNFVRRYAYMEKNFWQLMDFLETGYLSGQTQAIKQNDPRIEDVRQIGPGVFDNESLNGDDALLVKAMKEKAGSSADLGLKIAIAYLHQWKGSGKRQRGVSLTSTPKDNAVFGNAGESFRNPEFSAKFKIDLLIAKTKNEAEDPDNLLISHYAPGSPTRKAPYLEETTGLFSPPSSKSYKIKYKYEASMIKNRELYLQYVDKASVVEITIHEGSKEKKYEADEIDNIKDEPYYKNYMAGKTGIPWVTFSQDEAYYKKGQDWKKDWDNGMDDASKDPKCKTFSNENAILSYVFKKMDSKRQLPYWQGFAQGFFKALKERKQPVMTEVTTTPPTTQQPSTPSVTTSQPTPP